MRFEIDPRVVFRLGEDLISDDAQAMAELIKNAYDADSPWVKVSVDTAAVVPSVHGDGDLVGLITVEDAGIGMTREQIAHGWLRIAVSDKRVMKRRGGTTPKGRTPLGDKGLGRLGAQRLGEEIELDTKARGCEAINVRFSWSDFTSYETLSDVPVVDSPSPRNRVGTAIRIAGLRERSYWSSGAERQHLIREMSQIISPYEGVEGFDVIIEIDGVQLDFFELTSQLRDTAEARYELRFDGQQLRIRGDLRLAFLAPNRTTGAQVERFQRFALHDNGAAFAAWLADLPPIAEYGLRKPRRKNAFAGFDWTIESDAWGGLYRDDEDRLVSPGPFRGEVDSFDLGHSTVAAQGVFDTATEYRNAVRDFAGVRVYRDGFRVRTDQDLLGLARSVTSGRSAYGLDPQSTSGYLAISARDNEVLLEKTDREGFQDSPAFRNFRELLHAFAANVEQLHNAVGRGWVAFVKECLADEAEADETQDPEEAAEELGERLEEGRELSTRVATAAAHINSIVSTAQSLEERGEEADPESLAEASRELRATVETAQDLLGEIEAYLDRVTAASTLPVLLGHEIRSLREQVILSLETMSLGITAEALVHELLNVCDQLESRSEAFAKRATGGKLTERSAAGFADFVRASARSLRKQTSHLQPSLRYVRDRKDTIAMREFLEESAEHFRRRLHQEPITVAVKCGEDFRIRMNPGKLSQIVDNLLLNSEYWVREDLGQGVKAGSIELSIDRPRVTVSDSGPGVSADRAARIFEPFVTSRPEGRGLGLFIVRQLLDSEGCSIYLSPDRNRRGHHSGFVIDLSGALSE
jgi:signal transduction histidine kinase